MGLVALTAASFCVFLTLVGTLATAVFFEAAFRASGLAAVFFALTAVLGLAAVLLDAPTLTGLRAVVFALVALWAFGFDGDFAFTARFVVFAAGFAFDRDVDRLKPFVRLLLMGRISKGCSLGMSSR